MLCGCNSLLSINMNSLNMENVEDASYMFYNVKNIEYLEIDDVKVNDKFIAEIKGEYGLNNKDNLIVCQNKEIITNPNDEYICCHYDIKNHVCGCSNYISLKYIENVKYENGFNPNNQIESRNNVWFIYLDDKRYEKDDTLEIKENTNVKLCFRKKAPTLKQFFDASLDTNAKNIMTIDLTHFDSSLVTNMYSLFSGCKELLFLDMSYIDLGKIENATYMFNDNGNLKLIYFQYVKNVNKGKYDFSSLNAPKVVVCQADTGRNFPSLANKFQFICSGYIIENKKLIYTSNNYISIKYKAQSYYIAGFENYFRQNVKFITYENTVFDKYDRFTVKANTSLEVHFTTAVSSLQRFFSNDGTSSEPGDLEVVNITSIDFSHFASYRLTSTYALFYGCSSLEEINFTNFKIPSIKSMGYMFYKCQSLKSLNLSNFGTISPTSMTYMFYQCYSLTSLDFSKFETSRTTTMSYMFYQCSNLKSLDLSKFDTTKVTTITYMFYKCTSLEYLDISHFNTVIKVKNMVKPFDSVSLKYINIYNAQIDNIKTLIEGSVKDSTIICQSQQYFSKGINNCTFFNKITAKDQYNNYIKVKYKNSANYFGTFQNDYRQDIEYIIYKNKIIRPKDTFTIDNNDEIDILFIKPIKSLEKFFDYNNDQNVINILSVDLSHLDSSLITNTSRMFEGCSSLEKINFTNFDTQNVNDMTRMFYGCNQLNLIHQI